MHYYKLLDYKFDHLYSEKILLQIRQSKNHLVQSEL